MKKVKSMKLESLPLHPFTVVAFQILTVYSINVNEANFTTVMSVLLIALFFTALLFLLVSFIKRNNRQAAIIVTFYGFLFFIYGRILDILIEFPISGIQIGRNRNLLPFYGLIVIAGTLWIFRSEWCKKNLRAITYYFNMLSLGLVMIAVLTAAINFDWTILASEENAESKNYRINKEVHQISKNRENILNPNVYFLIFDSYLSHRVLKKYYNWDDSSLVNALLERGFSVNKNARSNYCFTGASIGSTLSMRYIHEDQGFIDAYNQDSYIGQFYKKNEVMERFKSEGYDIVSNIGDYRFTNNNNRKSLISDDFSQLIIHISMLRTIENELVTDQLRQGILSKLEALKLFEKPKKPTFLFLHIDAPHEPFVFNADGSRPKHFESAFGRYEYNEKYIEQVKFVGTQIIEIVDNLRQRDPTAVIIVQSDHGYGGLRDNIYLDRNSLAAKSNDHKRRPPIEYLDARFGIFSAIYLPSDIMMPINITPVNIFRYLFNAFFDVNLEILPDRAFFAVIKQPYYFHDVTNDLMRFLTSKNERMSSGKN